MLKILIDRHREAQSPIKWDSLEVAFMTVTLEGQQLKVILSDAETVKYGVDRVFFDRVSPLSKSALVELLKIASESCDFRSKATDFLIEIYPVFSGGCEIYFIPQAPTVKPKPSVKRVFGCEFYSSEGLLACIEALYRDKDARYCTSAVYKSGKSYRLTAQNLPARALRMILYNFSDRVLTLKELSDGKGTPICTKNAIAVIGSALCHESLD